MRADGILVSVVTGVGNAALVNDVNHQIAPHLNRGLPLDWIVDADKLEKTETSLMAPAVELLGVFKKGGGRYLIVIATGMLIRMTARTISFTASAAGASTIDAVVESMSEALAKLEELRKRKESA